MGKSNYQIDKGPCLKYYVGYTHDGHRRGRAKNYHWHVKRETRRFRRRLEKKLLDETPLRVVQGWEH